MPKPKRITPETMALLEAEARRRAECFSNKELASMTGLSRKYVANLISELRRGIEDEREHFHVSCGTVSE